MSNYFVLQENTVAKAPREMCNETTKNLWHHFTFTECNLHLEDNEGFAFQIGECDTPVLREGKEFCYNVNENGVYIVARDFSSLMRGYFDLLMQIEVDYTRDGALSIRAQTKEDSFTVKNRMIHFCIFKDTDRLRFRKFVRLAGVLGFTHIILEFWSTLKFNCLDEYGWEGSYTKEEVRDLLREIREFGMKPIPMINHLGHAAGSRITGGKHAVLDQNPKLHRLFMPDGWCWNIFNPEALEILRKMRHELYDLFGDCEFFHAGLDEAYIFSANPKYREALPDYLAGVATEILAEGRRPMLWMDMFLPKESGTVHLCSCSVAQMEAFLKKIPKETVLVDWDYDTTTIPLPTSQYLKGKTDHDIVIAPWDKKENLNAAIATAKECQLFGVMMTTWHSMFKSLHSILHAAQRMGCAKSPWVIGEDGELDKSETASILRKLSFEGPNSYENAGWVNNEILDNIGILL